MKIHFITKDLVMVSSPICKELLIQLVTKFCFQNWITMAFVGVPLNVLDHICLIGSNKFLLMENLLAYLQFLVVCPKALYWAHYSLLFT